jgi:F-type H+-transporting ATPase subunit delta
MKITPKKYAEALYELAEGKSEAELKELIGRFVENLAHSGKLNKANDIIDQFRRIWNEKNDTVEAEITSSIVLSKDTEKKLTDYISELTGAEKILLDKKIDKHILGGIVIKYSSTVMDGSLKAQLQKLKNKMIK